MALYPKSSALYETGDRCSKKLRYIRFFHLVSEVNSVLLRRSRRFKKAPNQLYSKMSNTFKLLSEKHLSSSVAKNLITRLFQLLYPINATPVKTTKAIFLESFQSENIFNALHQSSELKLQFQRRNI